MAFVKTRKTHYKIDETGHCCIAYIRKNACSGLKAMIIDDIGDLEDGKTVAQKMVDYRLCTYEDVIAAEVRSFIIRDPLHRIVSGWLNQVVQKIDRAYPEMFEGITKATGKDIHDVTFNDFVRSYLTTKAINGHFSPVVDHLYPVLYTHVLHDASLYEDACVAFGPQRADKFFLRPYNATKSIKSQHLDNAPDIPTREIFSTFKEQSLLPTKESFLNTENIEIIHDIYSQDINIYNLYLDKRNDNSGPISLDFSDRAS